MVERLAGRESLLVDAPDGARLLRISERRFHELRSEPGFPAAVLLGARCVRWHRDELTAYAKSLPRVTVLPEPQQRAARTAGRK
jgi:predicted DNA-binding transcriptional regulator AlpA